SGLPLPEPMRVSAGFLVMGLSGSTRIQILPPRLTWRVMAIRAASICRAVTQPASRACSPKSPKEIFCPRVARPRRRPRCCFLYLTFFGIIMMRFLLMSWRTDNLVCPGQAGLSALHLLRPSAAPGLGHLALVDPHLDPDGAVRGAGLGQTVVDVGLQRVQREAAILVPLG